MPALRRRRKRAERARLGQRVQRRARPVHALRERRAHVRRAERDDVAHAARPRRRRARAAWWQRRPRHQPAHRVPDQRDPLDLHRPRGHQALEQVGQLQPVLGDVAAGVVAQLDRREAELLAQAAGVGLAVAAGAERQENSLSISPCRNTTSRRRGVRVGRPRALAASGCDRAAPRRAPPSAHAGRCPRARAGRRSGRSARRRPAPRAGVLDSARPSVDAAPAQPGVGDRADRAGTPRRPPVVHARAEIASWTTRAGHRPRPGRAERARRLSRDGTRTGRRRRRRAPRRRVSQAAHLVGVPCASSVMPVLLPAPRAVTRGTRPAARPRPPAVAGRAREAPERRPARRARARGATCPPRRRRQ